MSEADKTTSREPDEGELHGSQRNLVRSVKQREARMLEARKRGEPDVYRSLAMLGIVGWSVTVPTLAGVALGVWIDRRWPSPISWTLTLLFVGLAIGCWNAWSHIRSGSKG